MPKDDTRLRRKALKLVQQVETAWAARGPGGFTGRGDAFRFVQAATRAETVLFRVVCGALDDFGPRVTYGEVMRLRSLACLQATGRTAATGAITAARGALWALDRPGISVTDPELNLAPEWSPPVKAELVPGESVTRYLQSDRRLAAAADARFALAERLAHFLPRPDGDEITPEAIDATLRARDKFHRLDETLVWKCQVETCRRRDAVDEARILAIEAELVYRALAETTQRYGPDDVSHAERRRDSVLDRLPLA
ncbi:hypothetical protein [Amycolatopsis nigrescens]|uniref:hypothetical protein n=1 Tax=Amycolatopsis nigrescens TaxID=381445 RepID=UPI000366A6DB|nr:hypothetical protein [Amycolatopsis nigrescens]